MQLGTKYEDVDIFRKTIKERTEPLNKKISNLKGVIKEKTKSIDKLEAR